jgi:hypothetical protein
VDNVNAKKLHIYTLNRIISVFQLYCNWFGYHIGYTHVAYSPHLGVTPIRSISSMLNTKLFLL